MTENQNDDFLLAKRIQDTEEKIAILASDASRIRKQLAAAKAELVAATQDRRAVAREAPDDPAQILGWLAQLKFTRETERDARFEVSRLHKALFALLRETRELEFEESKAIDGRFQFLPLFDPQPIATPSGQPANTVGHNLGVSACLVIPPDPPKPTREPRIVNGATKRMKKPARTGARA